jgi:dTMP kinase
MLCNNHHVNNGTLIAFEGIDGSGKSTQAELAADALRAAGYDPLLTREPTDGPVGQRIRAMARSGERVPPLVELGWFLEDRREHVSEVIAPALARGRVVITDRYTLSSVAYQGARGLAVEEILAASERDFPLPDLVLVVELEAKLALERVRARGGLAEPSFEQLDFLERVAENFAQLSCSYIERVAGSGAVGEVQARILAALRHRLHLQVG